MSLLDEFNNITLERLHEYISAAQEENVQLEFKTISKSDLTAKDDKQNLSIALSGFANSIGGLIVWGVVADKNNPLEIDCAHALKEITKVSIFEARLNELTGESLLPRLDGIQHRIIKTTEDRGFAITFVPESDMGPHMAKLGENRYYKRNGSSFRCMEHFDIADMFGRRKKPKLVFTTRVMQKGNRCTINLGLRNDGRAVAKAPYMSFKAADPFTRDKYGVDGSENEGLTKLSSSTQEGHSRYGGDMNFVIHPGITHEVAAISNGFYSQTSPSRDLTIEYVIGADEMPIEHGSIIIPVNELRLIPLV